MKMKAIKFRAIGNCTDHPRDDKFIVDVVTNSIEFLPGAIMLRPAVQELCEAKDWTVTVIQPRS